MSDTSKQDSGGNESPFVDPWSHQPNHQGEVQGDAQFVGAWGLDLGIDSIHEALFVVRDDRQDLLWSLTTPTEKLTKQNLIARKSGDPGWIKSKITCGCVAGAPVHGTMRGAATALLDMLVRSRVHFSGSQPPYLPGLLAGHELANIVGSVADQLEHNSQMAEAKQLQHEAPIITLARELNLNPRPAGHNDSAWMADCPRRSHSIMISPSNSEFGCGYCKRKGGPEELRAFYDYVKSQGQAA